MVAHKRKGSMLLKQTNVEDIIFQNISSKKYNNTYNKIPTLLECVKCKF